MNDKPLDELYFEWLYGQVGSTKIRTKSRTYWNLLRLLFKKEFVWIVPKDDNRIEDGKDLRYEFIHDQEIEYVSNEWLDLGCSMLELMIGLSRRLWFEDDGDSRDWFWHLVGNIGLEDYTDNVDIPEDTVHDILDTIIWRQYARNGSGGFFPLRRPSEDQRDVELWYQLSAYLLEHT